MPGANMPGAHEKEGQSKVAVASAAQSVVQTAPAPEQRPVVLVFVAHSDDQVLGAGGAIAKYAADGCDVKTIVCSFGEMSHPHLKPEIIRKMRVLESKKADRILGGQGVSFLGLREGKFWSDATKDKERILKNLVKRLREMKPVLVLAPDAHDLHPDHRSANRVITEALRRLRSRAEVFTFSVYRLINFKRGRTPRLYVDITPFFRKKIEALHAFKSQINPLSYAQTNNIVYLGIYVCAFFAGRKNKVRYAEVFYRQDRKPEGKEER